MYQNVIFREYDIRGVYNKEFDKDFAYLLGRAYAQYFNEKLGKTNLTITLGHDARVSSPEIKASLSKVLQDSGVRVLYI